MSANVGYVGHKATHLVTPVEGNQPLAGRGRPVDLGAARSSRRPLFATAPLITNISTTAARGRSDYNGLQMSLRQRNVKGVEYLASYTLSRTRTNNLGYYGSGGVQAEGAYWANAYDPEANYGPAFFDARHNFVLSANYELPFGKGRKCAADASNVMDAIIGGWRLSGIFQARSGLPDHGHRRPRPFAAGHARQRAAELRRRSEAVGSEHQSLDRHQRLRRRAARHVRQLSDRRGGRAPGYKNIDAVLAKQFNVGGSRYFEFRAEAFNLTNTPSFGPPARDINAPNTFGTITSTVSSPRTVEMVLKFFF